MTFHVHISGDSHSWILSRGVAGLAKANEAPREVDFSFRPMGRQELLLSRFHRVVDGDLQVIEKGDRSLFRSFPGVEGKVACGICTNFAGPRVIDRRMTGRFAPVALAIDEAHISEAALQEIFRTAAEHLFDFLEEVRSRGVPLFVVEGPRLFANSPVFATVRQELAIEVERQYRTYLRLELAQRGIPNIAMPDDCMGADGLMLPAYLSAKPNDFVHGNVAFAELMLRRVYAHVADPDWVEALRRSVSGGADLIR